MNKTTTEIQVFQSDEFGAVRTLLIDGVPWFVGKDIAAALGYGRAAKAIQDHVDAEDKDEVPIRDSIGRMQKTPLINESGMYSLILSSQLPRAREFKHWVTAEVLPTIRKHGAYMTDSVLEKVSGNPDAIYSLAEQLLKERQARNEVTALLAVAKPKADYFDAFINGSDFTCIRNCGKELEYPQKKFINFMLDHKYLYRDSESRLMPSANSIKRGFFVLRDFYLKNGRMMQQTMMTNKGKEHFRRLLEKEARK